MKVQPLSARKVLELFAAENGGPVGTRDLLAFHLREGNVEARARHKWASIEQSVAEAWTTAPPPKNISEKSRLKKKHVVKASEWRASVDWINDVQSWDFKRSRFHITISLNPLRRIMLKDIRFHAGEVSSYFSIKGKKRPGAKPELAQWRMFWHRIIAIMQDGRDDFGGLTHPDVSSNIKLRNKISDLKKDDKQPDWLAQIAKRIDETSAFTLKDDAMLEEITKLRKKFKLTKRTGVSGEEKSGV